MTWKKRPTILGCLYILLALQLLGTLFFVTELWSEILSLRSWSVAWKWQDFIQILASVALILGTAAAFGFTHHNHTEMRRMHRKIDVVSGQFHDHVRAHFSSKCLKIVASILVPKCTLMISNK